MAFMPFLNHIESNIYAYFMRASLAYKQASSEIVLITVDQATIKAIWSKGSWNTGRYAGLLDIIEQQQPKAVVFDYFFPEKTFADNADWSLIAKLEKRSEDDISDLYSEYSDIIYHDKNYVNSNDADFASLMGQYQNVFLPYSFKRTWDGSLLAQKDKSVPAIYQSVARSGFVNAFYGPDGSISEILPTIALDSSLALSVVRFVSPELEAKIPKKAPLLLNFFSKPYDAYTAIQFHKAYDGNFVDYSGKTISLKDKIIIVGDYHESLGDIHKVPIYQSTVMSGMEVLANEIQMHLDGAYIHRLTSLEIGLLIIGLASIFFLIFSLGWNIILHGLVMTGGIVGYVILSFFFFRSGYYFPIFSGILAILLPFLVWYVHRAIVNSYEKEKIRNIFSKHVDRTIVQTLIEKWFQIRPEKQEISILFCDIEGFTTLSETQEPAELIQTLNTIFHTFNDCIFAQSGTINKYIWDAIMAFWWAPISNPNHAFLAVKTALEMQKSLENLSKTMEQQGIPWVRARIGINTGTVIVGNIGDEHYSDYTVIGDAVNTASRLEGINKYYFTNILITGETYERVKESYGCRKIDTVLLKWKEFPTDLFEVVSEIGLVSDIQMERKIQHETALAYYIAWDFTQARRLFSDNLNLRKDMTAKAFLERIDAYGNRCPENWNGVYEFEVK